MSGDIVTLDRLMVLEDPVRADDGAGGHVETWVPLGTLWANLSAGSGQERGGETITLSTVPYRIVVRAAPVTAPSRPRPEQRLRLGARVFRILAVSEYGTRGRYLTCHAREEVVK